MYAALDLCVAVVSLRDWSTKAVVNRARKAPIPTIPNTREAFLNLVREKVRWQGAVEAIANTLKHGEYRDGTWPEGYASPQIFFPESLRSEREGIDDEIDLIHFVHRHRDVVWWDVALTELGSDSADPGYVALGDNLDDWRELLGELGLIVEEGN